MIPLAIFASLFVLGHLALSSAPGRKRVIEAVGERGFLPVYSLVAAITLAATAFAYAHAPAVVLWQWPRFGNVLPLAAMPFALLMVVGGLTTPNPAAMFQDPAKVAEPKGVTAITRHPFMSGVALWAVVHLAVNGDLASQILFGAMLALTLLGTLHIDIRRRAQFGEDWKRYAKATSWLPFLAIALGRARFRWRDVGVWRIVVTLALYALLAWAHPILFGASPLPW